MSKGLSKLQRHVVGLLDGSIKHTIYSGGKGSELTTRELLEELVEAGLLPEGRDRKQAMFTVRRACMSLLRRDLLTGRYAWDCDNVGRRIATWKTAPAKAGKGQANHGKHQ